MRRFMLAVVVVALAAACGEASSSGGEGGVGAGGSGGAGATGGTGGSGGSGAVTWADVRTIFSDRCSGVGCHFYTRASLQAFAGRDFAVCAGLRKYDCALELVSRGVMPKNRGCTGDPSTDGLRSGCLDADELERLRAWVEADAPP